MFKVGITGGIGSGKSTLCRMFGELGIPIYNSDARAKELMRSSAELREAIIETFGAESYVGGELNRVYLAGQVFGNKERLQQLNALVHPCVRHDFKEWSEAQDAPYVILECALLFDAGFNEYVNRSLCVLTPEPMRIERIISRDNLTEEQAKERIAAQMPDDQVYTLSDYSVVNFEIEDLEDAAKVFDKKFRYEAQQN